MKDVVLFFFRTYLYLLFCAFTCFYLQVELADMELNQVLEASIHLLSVIIVQTQSIPRP